MSDYKSCVHPKLIKVFLLSRTRFSDENMMEFEKFTNLTVFSLVSCPGITKQNAQRLITALTFVPDLKISNDKEVF